MNQYHRYLVDRLYLEVELKESIMSFRFSFVSLSHSKIETDQQHGGGAISSHRNSYILIIKSRAKSRINIV